MVCVKEALEGKEEDGIVWVKCQDFCMYILLVCVMFVCEVGGCVSVTSSAEKEITSGQKGIESRSLLGRRREMLFLISRATDRIQMISADIH